MEHLRCSSAGVSLHATQHHSSFGAAVLRVVGGNASRSILAWRMSGDSRRADGSAIKAANEGKRGPWPMSDITREELASAVATTISSVRRAWLLREVARLIR